MARITTKDLAELLEKIQSQLSTLVERVERLESAAATRTDQNKPAAAATPVKPQAPAPVKADLTEEDILAVSAALAAYLGVRVRIKHIRLLSSQSWAQQGRVWIQASHKLH